MPQTAVMPSVAGGYPAISSRRRDCRGGCCAMVLAARHEHTSVLVLYTLQTPGPILMPDTSSTVSATHAVLGRGHCR